MERDFALRFARRIAGVTRPRIWSTAAPGDALLRFVDDDLLPALRLSSRTPLRSATLARSCGWSEGPPSLRRRSSGTVGPVAARAVRVWVVIARQGFEDVVVPRVVLTHCQTPSTN